MRSKAVFLLILMGTLSFTFSRSTDARCEDEMRVVATFQKLRKQYPHVSPPIGMGKQDLAKLLVFMEEHEHFSDAEVIVLYGSRTNHSEGPKPLAISDLDVLVHWDTDTYDTNQLVRKSVEGSDSLRPWHQELGFTVEIQIPGVMSFDRFLADRVPLFDAIKEMRALDETVRLENWDAHAHRMAFKDLMNRHKSHVNPGAIFVLKNPKRALQWEIELRKLGFSQILHLY